MLITSVKIFQSTLPIEFVDECDLQYTMNGEGHNPIRATRRRRGGEGGFTYGTCHITAERNFFWGTRLEKSPIDIGMER